MSLTEEGLKWAMEKNFKLNVRVNRIFKELGINLSSKVQDNHYGMSYLFGKEISEEMTDDEIIAIIKSTPEEEYHGSVDWFGRWNPKPDKQNKDWLG